MNQVYQIITDMFISKLEEGVIPWKKGWDAPGARAMNMISKRKYSGVNVLITSMAGFGSPYWATFNQINQAGGKIIKGQKGTPIIFFKMMENEEKGEKFPMLRYFKIWNREQVEGLPASLFPEDDVENSIEKVTGTADDACRPILLSYTNRPKIRTGGDAASYNPAMDSIWIPKRKFFNSLEEYWATLFHELAHSTGHQNRLNRQLTGSWNRQSYSFEELVAEITAAFLCAEAEISNDFDNHAAYVASWLKVLKNEPKWIIDASRKAAKAASYIIGAAEEMEKAA